ncbi:MAG: peptidase M14, partial [Lachnospiraceae bacterium]|nr:peptidase M14 [Lachnospiraceae bacterium]
MKQAEFYIKNYEQGSYKGVNYKDMFNKVCLHIIPMVNPDGVTISQFGTEKINNEDTKDKLYEYYQRDLKKGFVACDYKEYLSIWKSNSIGTDINKNFDHAWDSYEGPVVPSRLNYKGSAAESEPETRALVNTVKHYNIVGSIAYHATGSIIYWDYGQTGDLRTKCYDFVKAVKEINNYTVYFAKDREMTPAGYSDWCVVNNGIPAITCEVGTGKAPVPLSEFNTIWKDNKMVVANVCYLYYK